MKKKLFFILVLVIISIGILNQKTIVTYITKNYLYKNDFVIPESNEYKLGRNFDYVKITNDFTPQNKQDLLNIVYTTLDNGWEEFSFYCPQDYKDCTKEVDELFSDQATLSHLNNFVHPFNSYNKITVNMNSLGKITIQIDKLYTGKQIKLINQKIDEIYNQLIHEPMSDRDKIKSIHDYLINQTVYDEERSIHILEGNDKDSNSNSHTAYGLLFENKAICGGYSDTMALFLHKMKIPNLKVSTYDHVWNAVYIDNTWLHLDLTWDDPVTSTHENMLMHTFFLLTKDQLTSQNTGQHNFDKKIYSEL